MHVSEQCFSFILYLGLGYKAIADITSKILPPLALKFPKPDTCLTSVRCPRRYNRREEGNDLEGSKARKRGEVP